MLIDLYEGSSDGRDPFDSLEWDVVPRVGELLSLDHRVDYRWKVVEVEWHRSGTGPVSGRSPMASLILERAPWNSGNAT